MPTDSNAYDDTDWSGLTTSAGDGELMLEPGIAERCAKHVEAMLNSVVGVLTWIDNNSQLASPVIASTPSGDALQTIFGFQVGVGMPYVMNMHRNVLTDMGNTFVAAGKHYASTDTDSAVNFENISFDDPGGTAPSGAPEPPVILADQPPPSYPGTTMQAVVTVPEEGSNFSWQQLYSIGQSINPRAVADAAGVWYWLAKNLAENFSTLGSNIEAAANQWVGNGASRAISATKRYVEAAGFLTSDMNKMGDVLLHTARWLQDTKNNMPTHPDPPTTIGSGYHTSAADIAAKTAAVSDRVHHVLHELLHEHQP